VIYAPNTDQGLCFYNNFQLNLPAMDWARSNPSTTALLVAHMSSPIKLVGRKSMDRVAVGFHYRKMGW
jgi:hypothetical protein